MASSAWNPTRDRDDGATTLVDILAQIWKLKALFHHRSNRQASVP